MIQAKKYVQRTAMIEAIKWTGANEPYIREFINKDENINFNVRNELQIWNRDSQTWIRVPVNSYVAKGRRGELYSIPPEDLMANFDVIE